MKLLVAMSGASGQIYAGTLMRYLVSTEIPFNMLATATAIAVAKSECNYIYHPDYSNDSFFAPCASSSSWDYTGMVIVPCSMGMVSRIATGTSSCLIERAADVAIKEKKPLVIVPRETPLSEIHLENLLKLSRLGVHILPACPGFYTKPETIQDLANDLVGKILQYVSIPNNLRKKWNANERSEIKGNTPPAGSDREDSGSGESEKGN